MFIGYTRELAKIKGAPWDKDVMRLYDAGCDTVYSDIYDGWARMCKEMQAGDTLVLVRPEDVPDELDFDTLVIVLDMIANSGVMLLDDDGRLHRVMPKKRYGRVTGDDI